MKCLVTGAAGFIGSHLSEALLAKGHTVVGVDCLTDYYPRKIKLRNLSTLRRAKAFKFVQADLSKANLTPIVKGADSVFHLAAQPGVRASWGKTFSHYVEDNIVATQKLLEAVKGTSLERFVYASSSSIYGEAERMPTPEDATPTPVSPYGSTKLAAEHLCRLYYRSYGLPAVSLRYFTVYGPRQRPDMAFNRFISRISAGREIDVYGDGEQKRDFTFVKDIVAGNLLALRAKPGEAYNLGAGKTFALKEVIGIIESAVGRKAKIKMLHSAAGDVKNTSADISKASRELGYKPKVGIEAGIREQVSWQL